MKKFFLLSIVLSVYVFLGVVLYNYFIADVYYYSSRQLFEKHQYSKALEASLLAMKFNPNEPSYYRQAARAYLGANSNTQALETLQNSINLNEKNLTTLRNSIPLYYALAQTDKNYLGNAINYFEELKNTYPNDLGVLTDIAKYEKMLGLIQNYNETTARVKSLRPDLLEWHESFII